MDIYQVKQFLDFYVDEIADSNVYSYAASKTKDHEKKVAFNELSRKEKEHADFWKNVIERRGAKLTIPLLARFKIFFTMLMVKILSYSLVIKLFELTELSTIKKYAEIYDSGILSDEELNGLKSVIIDELEHEEYFLQEVLKIKPLFDRIRDAMYGMVDALVEVLAVVIGLASIISDPVIVGLGGVIAGSAGTLSMAAGAYLSAKSQGEVLTSKLLRLRVLLRHEPSSMLSRIMDYYTSIGVEKDDAGHIVDKLRKYPNALSKLAESIEVKEGSEVIDPKRAALDAGLYYLIASFFPISPFLIFRLSGMVGIFVSIISTCVVLIISGYLISLVTGISPSRKILEMISVALGAAAVTYLIGTASKILLGIEVI